MSDDLMKRAREAWKTGDDWEAMVLLRPTANRIEELEAKLATCTKYRDAYAECDRISTHALRKAMEALECLIQHTHNCEKELTESLYHLDFCGESEPLTKARTTLAELKGETDG